METSDRTSAEIRVPVRRSEGVPPGSGGLRSRRCFRFAGFGVSCEERIRSGRSVCSRFPEKGGDIIRDLCRDFGGDRVFRHAGCSFAGKHQMIQVVIEKKLTVRFSVQCIFPEIQMMRLNLEVAFSLQKEHGAADLLSHGERIVGTEIFPVGKQWSGNRFSGWMFQDLRLFLESGKSFLFFCFRKSGVLAEKMDSLFLQHIRQGSGRRRQIKISCRNGCFRCDARL